MSRKLASLCNVAISAITFFSNERQKKKVEAWLYQSLSSRSLVDIECKEGSLKLNVLASPHAANTAINFFKDEPETIQWINSFEEGDVFYDIGAGVGIYSLYAALNETCLVYSFEPNGLSFGLLVEHTHINQLYNINPLALAISDSTKLDSLLLRQVSQGAGGSSVGKEYYRRHKEKPQSQQTIITVSLDDLVNNLGLKQPNHLKIDVDGMEPDIIRGGMATLEGASSILIEIENRKEKEVEVLILSPLRELGFTESNKYRNMGSGRNKIFVK